MAFKKAKGLCYKCGSRWHPGHKCATNVPLHVVEELWQLVQDTAMPPALPVHPTDSDSSEDLCAVSLAAVNGQEVFKTIRFLSNVNKKEVVVLADSGSSGNFISELMASSMTGWQELPLPIKVRVANGTVLTCTHEIQNCPIWINGHCFNVNLKILPLQCYDIILGIDWLEDFSPMEVHWKDKWMSFMHKGVKVTLQGVEPNLTDCISIAPGQLEQLIRKDELWCILQLYAVQSDDILHTSGWPEDIDQLISQFSDLFAEPKELPPKRPYDHSIPFIAGAQPFRLRPSRYNPGQKDEIEQQVAELLKNGMIQASTSPFASPVLLVRKKNGEWRFCVDYRRLNAYTVKDKFPLPVIDEFMDELVGAKWFTSLYMRSGFHQIRMKEADQHKSAFQTHHGYFEYKVIPYGVTGGPATFQRIMNSILASLLRVCVIVFIGDILFYSKTWEDHVQHVAAVF